MMLSVLVIFAVLSLYTTPASLSLASGRRSGLEKQTIAQAAEQLEASGMEGWSLVEAARVLVSERMQYSRRNGFDTAATAFDKGYGFCMQMAYALADLLRQLGFEAKVVHAFRNQLPDQRVSGHAWVEVTFGDESRYVDSLHYDARAGELDFKPLSEVVELSPSFKPVAWWGSAVVNAYRYYSTGEDS